MNLIPSLKGGEVKLIREGWAKIRKKIENEIEKEDSLRRHGNLQQGPIQPNDELELKEFE